MKSQLVPIGLNFIASFAGAFGQYYYKWGAARMKDVPFYQNWQILIGMILFIAVMVFFIVAFRMGGRLSVTYPIYALTFIWGTLLGVWWDGETINTWQVGGIGLVVIGVSLVAAFAEA